MKKALLFVALTALFGLASFGGPVVTGVWYEFGFDTPPDNAVACVACTPSSGTLTVYADDPPWTFVLGGPGTITVTDAFLKVDSFEIFDFGASIGLTDAFTPGGTCGNDPVPCLADPDMSSGIFALGAGAHSISIRHLTGQAGAAYFLIQEKGRVPEPATFGLMAASLAGLAVWRRRRM